MIMDLHVHTIASDGEYTPAEVVTMAKEKNVGVLAVTDHDTIDGLAETLLWGDKLGVTVIPGVELNAKHTEELHILGYGFRQNHPDLEAACQWLRQGRKARAERIIHWLQSQGVALTLPEVKRFAQGHQLGRPHFARALVEKGYAQSVEEAFDRYLSGEDFARIEREKLSAEAAVKLIVQAGGIAVLAHPLSLKLDSAGLEEYVSELQSYGLRGMECYYSANTPEWTTACLQIAERHQLLVTGGSDFHGEMTKRGVQIGSGRDGNLHFYSDALLKVLQRETYWGQHGQDD